MSFTTSRLRGSFAQVQHLRRTGQTAAADMLVAQILAAVPSGVDDLYCQASLLLEAGRPTDALKRFDDAIRRGPVPAELMVDRAVALSLLGRFADAAAACDAALEAAPGFAPAHLIKADALRDLGQSEGALGQYGAALARQKDMLPALRNRAALLRDIKRFAEALGDLDRLVRLEPGDPDIHSSRCIVLGELDRFEDALASLANALALNPRHLTALHNRGVTLWSLGRFEEALASYDQALALNPALAVTQSNRANTLQELGRLEEAALAHDRVVAAQPDFASGHWNRSQGRMLRGDWNDGLAEFEWRKRAQATGTYLAVPQPEWLGTEPLDGKTLLIHAEGGLGDTLHFARYAALAGARGARVILAVQPPLVRLLREGLIPQAIVVDRSLALPDFDFHIAAMSLPLAFSTGVETAPAQVPYLKADLARIAAWRARLGPEGFRIGISWQGGRAASGPGRAFALRLLAPIAALPGIRLISLQKGEAKAQLAATDLAVETLGDDFDAGPDAFVDTAAVMQSLDLVISADTAIAHLAGALARPVWLATKFVPEWRWLLGRSDSVWYPTLRLFRQTAPGDWSAVFTGMAEELRRRLG